MTKSPKYDVGDRIPQAMETMESLIETEHRFQAYQLEVRVIKELGITFHEWLELTPQGDRQEKDRLTYLMLPENLNI